MSIKKKIIEIMYKWKIDLENHSKLIILCILLGIQHLIIKASLIIIIIVLALNVKEC